MTILDSKGRLFGKLSVLDLGAALVIVGVIIGIFFFPGTDGSLAQVNATKPIEVEVLVRGLQARDPQIVLNEFEEAGKTDIVIRNQPSGSVAIADVEQIDRYVSVPQPDGTVKALPQPSAPTDFSTDFIVTLAGDAQITSSGAVLNKSQVKVGTLIELDGRNYNFKGTIIDVREVAE